MFFQLMGLSHFFLYFLEFLIAAWLVLQSGEHLSKYADTLAEKSHLTAGWIGFILMATITSLPELMTGISAASLARSSGLVLGDTVGSNAVNIVILGIMFLLVPKAKVDLKIDDMVAGFAGLFLVGLVGASLLFQRYIGSSWIGHGVNLVIFASYIYILGAVFKAGGLKEEPPEEEDVSMAHIKMKIFISAVGIVFASVWMTKSAELIAKTPFPGTTFMLGESFIGALLLAIATSLPELSVCVHSARLGNVDMAVGNIFGSNIFNMAIIPISALFYRGNFWLDANPSNLNLVLLVFLVTGMMGVNLVSKAKTGKKGLSLLDILTMGIWILGMTSIIGH